MEDTGKELALIIEALAHGVEYQEGFIKQLGKDQQTQSMREVRRIFCYCNVLYRSVA